MKTILILLFLFLFVATEPFGQVVPIRILEIPKPELPKDYGILDAQGTIRLKVQCLAEGRVGLVTPITRLTANLTELAIEAAKKIRFESEKIGGSPVDRSITLQYSYGWNYGGWKIQNSANINVVKTAKANFDEQTEAIIQKAVQNLGGEKYLKVYSQVAKGKFSIIKEGVNISFQSFVDVIVFPDKERTEFKQAGVKTVQTNTGETGWVFDGDQELIKVQTEKQIANFKRGQRTSLDYLLRGYWKGDAELTYLGRRSGTLGKRNDVLKLTYKDDFAVEFEFTADEGIPVKAIYKQTNADGETITEEDRYAQFIETQGVKAPYIVDRFTNDKHASRINFETIEYNKSIPDSIFAKPSDIKALKKDLRL
ncbi:MAG: hypothetical protein ACRD6X_18755 [Pyrinomonadaceae bacterium]